MKISPAAMLVAVLSVAWVVTSLAAPPHTNPGNDAPASTPLLGLRVAPPEWAAVPSISNPPAIERAHRGASYLVITDGRLLAPFLRFAAWKWRHRVPTEVRTLSSIRRQYPAGVDDAERVRLCIRDAHARGTRWVLLGGDTEVIPTRIVHSNFFASIGIAPDFPSDHYFACLDGNWNADGDEFFGEAPGFGAPGDSVDLVPEVFVGRAPVRTLQEAKNFVEKTVGYEAGRAAPESRQTLLFAEVFLPKPWNGDPELLELDLARYVETLVRNPPGPGLDAVRLYENHADPDYLPGALPENRASVLGHLSRGYPLSVFVGRSSSELMSVGPDLLSIDDVLASRNRNALTNLFSFGASTHDITTQSIGEAFVLAPRGGAVTSIGPSTNTFITQTAAMMREYFRLWLTGEAVTAGELSARHRLNGSVEYQQCAILLGDPQLRIVPEASTRHHLVLEDRIADAVVESPAPARVSIAPRPNPARDRIAIDVDLAAAARGQTLNVAVFDLSGRRVRTLESGVVTSGRLTPVWDLLDAGGRRVGEGVYFVTVRVGDATRSSRLLVVR